MRIDKFTWCVRLSKTRSIAAEAVAKGKVKLNGVAVKPSREVVVGDVLSFQKHNSVFNYEVLLVPKSRLGAKLVLDYLKDITAPEEVEKYRVYQLNQSGYRENGKGKPSRKDRRDIKNFLGEE
ncbi:MAG: ribosome-associated heat shock protein Hsp15 [Saprospiraceae bacterium]|jgi:ribosome-associated heat shock protein Hsp15